MRFQTKRGARSRWTNCGRMRSWRKKNRWSSWFNENILQWISFCIWPGWIYLQSHIMSLFFWAFPGNVQLSTQDAWFQSGCGWIQTGIYRGNSHGQRYSPFYDAKRSSCNDWRYFRQVWCQGNAVRQLKGQYFSGFISLLFWCTDSGRWESWRWCDFKSSQSGNTESVCGAGPKNAFTWAWWQRWW